MKKTCRCRFVVLDYRAFLWAAWLARHSWWLSTPRRSGLFRRRNGSLRDWSSRMLEASLLSRFLKDLKENFLLNVKIQSVSDLYIRFHAFGNSEWRHSPRKEEWAGDRCRTSGAGWARTRSLEKRRFCCRWSTSTTCWLTPACSSQQPPNCLLDLKNFGNSLKNRDFSKTFVIWNFLKINNFS